MPQVSIDNEVISIQLAQGESTTVPDGETWVTDMTVHGNDGRLSINGVNVVNDNSNSGNPPATSHHVVLAAGDTVANNGQGDGIHIGGFKV